MDYKATGFPFTIMDVASLLRLNIRREGSGHIYVDCPICGDRRGKMNLNLTKNVWRCNYCGEGGGMLALYAKVYRISNSDAYKEICDALQTGSAASAYSTPSPAGPNKEMPQAERASEQEIHRTFTTMMSALSLTPAHREHLRSKRGLTDAQIDQFGFKSTPPPEFCRILARQLAEFGYRVQGVPGFYIDDYGKWTIKFHRRTSGILIPIRSVEGLLCGLQTRLDKPIRDKDDPPEKSGIKYLTLSSTGKNMGTTSKCPIHFVGDPCSRIVYVTEGALKADIVHALTGRSFAAMIGANNTAGLDELFAFLRKNGTEEIIEAEDMDKYSNDMVSKGASKVCQLAVKHGMTCRRLVWNPNYKGIDDWQLALHRKNEIRKEDVTINMEQQLQLFRVYQLDLDGIKTYPFAFRSIEVMRKVGYQQRRRQITGWSMTGRFSVLRMRSPRMYWNAFSFAATIPSPRAIGDTVCLCPTWWSCMTKKTGAISIVTSQALSPYNFPLSWQNHCQKRIMAHRSKAEQLEEMSSFCHALGVEVQYHPLHRYFTAMFWDGWDLAYREGPALAVQQEIQRQSAQYPDLVCYCFDPFSTLIYAI